MRLLILSLLFLPLFSFSQFGPESIITISANDGAMVRTFDCDSDGDQDVITAVGQGILLFKNNGTGGMSTPVMLKKNAVSALDVADFDGDGILDVAAASGSVLFLIHNNGNGTFVVPDTVYSGVPYYQDFNTLVAADMDGDGDQDILTSAVEMDRVYWYENDGTGSFATEHEIIDGSDPSDVFAADIDNDGDNDVIYSLNSNGMFWIENIGNGVFDNGTFNPQVPLIGTLQNVAGIFACDLDNDGDKDILAASGGNNTIAWFRNDAGIFTSALIISTTATFALEVTASDVDADGDLDVIYGAQYESGWHENLGAGNFGPEIQISGTSAGAIHFISVADLDNDSDEDLVALATTGANRVISFINNGGTFGQANAILGSAMDIRSIEYMDIDNDGDQDIITASYTDDKIAFHENLGNGQFTPQQLISSLANGPEKVISADIDGDQLIDIISASSLDNKIAWYKNTGGQFGAQQIISSSVTGIRSIDAADFDNDGDMDIAAAFENNDRYIWFENLGSGTFSAIKNISNVLNNPAFVCTADMDGDGIKDVVGGAVDSPIMWFKKNGASWITHQISNGFEPCTSGPQVADLDNDGDNDVLVSYSYLWNYQLIWFENLGAGTFSARKVISNEPGPINDTKLVDIDLDGDIDILTANQGSYYNGLCWFENEGNGQFTKRPFANGDFLRVLVTDFDNDGDGDVLSAQSLIDKISLYKNNLLAPFQARGNFYVDANQNGQRDSLETGFALPGISSTPNEYYQYTFDNGRYSVDFDPSVTTNYLLVPSDYDHWGITSDSLEYHVSVDPGFIYRDSLDFGFYPTDLFDSLTPIVAGEFPRCNSTVTYWLSLKNNGTTHPSGIMEFVMDSSITFVSSSLTPDSISANHYYWSYDSLDWFSSTQVQLQVQLPSFTSMGDTLSSYLHAFVPDTSGATVYSSSGSLNQILVCAYDPNDKAAEPMGFGPNGFILPDVEYIDYTIRFQNTGNDTSITVKIQDQLDTNFVWNSLSTLASSHQVETTVNSAGEVLFNFDQIYLPDSIVNEPASHGFVKYRIWLKPGLEIGTTFKNTANIYFDYNPAVVTNTTIHTLFECSEVNLLPMTTSICEGSDLQGSVGAVFSDELSWKIDSLFDIESDELIWHSDTSGVFNLQVSRNNPYCHTDTVLSITIYPAYEVISDSLQVCSGEAIEIFGNLESTSGNYYHTFSSVHGCDSLVVIHLDVKANPFVELAAFSDDTICIAASPFALPVAVPGGGTYGGNGVDGNSFNPVLAGVGTQLVTYTYQDSLGCLNSDSTMITIETCLNVTENQLLGWTIFPNPVHDQLFIELNEASEMDVFDLTGKVIQHESLQSGNNTINVSGLTPGVYFIQSKSGANAKFVKE